MMIQKPRSLSLSLPLLFALVNTIAFTSFATSQSTTRELFIPCPAPPSEGSPKRPYLEAALEEALQRESDKRTIKDSFQSPVAPTPYFTSTYEKLLENSTVVYDAYDVTSVADQFYRTRVLRGRRDALFMIKALVKVDSETNEELIVSETGMKASELIVKFSDDIPYEIGAKYIKSVGGSIARPVGSIGYYLVSLEFYGPATIDNALTHFAEHPEIIAVAEPNYLGTLLATPNDEYYSGDEYFLGQWGLHNSGQWGGTVDVDIDAPEAWDIVHDAPNIVIAIMDTDVLLTHEDLASNLWENNEEATGTADVDDDNNGWVDDIYGIDLIDDDGDPGFPSEPYGETHGTMVAGVAGAQGNNTNCIAGVAWNVQLMMIRFSFDDTYEVADAIDGIAYARAEAADQDEGIDGLVVNMSWGKDIFSESLKQEMENAQNDFDGRGTIFVAAAGNLKEDLDQNQIYPAAFDLDNIIAVGAVDRWGEIWEQGGSGSAYGELSVDIAAPGADIRTIMPPNNDSFSTPMTGTSISAPHIAGAAALLKTMFPYDDFDDIRNRMIWTVKHVEDFEGKSVSEGMLDLDGALYIWSNGIELGDGDKYIDWIKYFNDTYHPWILHEEHGWWYTVSTSTDDLYIYDYVLGWMWTTEDIYPFLYRFDEEEWFFYSLDSTDPRWFCDMSIAPPANCWSSFDESWEGATPSSEPPEDDPPAL